MDSGQTHLRNIGAVIDRDSLFCASGVLNKNLPIEIAIRGKDAKDAKGEIFFGNPRIFATNPELTYIYLPYGSWQIAAIQRDGWPVRADNVWHLRLLFMSVTLFLLETFLIHSGAHQNAESIRQRLSATREGTPPTAAVQWSNTDGSTIYWNKASEWFYGWHAESAMGKRIDQLILSPKASVTFTELLERIDDTGEPVGPIETEMLTRDGETR